MHLHYQSSKRSSLAQQTFSRSFLHRKYPSLDEVSSELINVVDHLNIPQAVFFGEGAGANIACRFAIEYPSRVHGLVLVHPTGTTAGFMEMMKDKLNNWKLIHKGMNPDAEAYLIWHRFGRVCFPPFVPII